MCLCHGFGLHRVHNVAVSFVVSVCVIGVCLCHGFGLHRAHNVAVSFVVSVCVIGGYPLKVTALHILSSGSHVPVWHITAMSMFLSAARLMA